MGVKQVGSQLRSKRFLTEEFRRREKWGDRDREKTILYFRIRHNALRFAGG